MAVGSLTDWAEIAILNGLHRSAALPRVGTLYCALFSGDPTDAGTGPEITTGGVVRQPLAVANASWTAPAQVGTTTARQIALAVEIVFPAPTAAYTPTHWGFFDAVTGGNLWLHGPIDGTPRAVVSGDDALRFAVGSITLTLSGGGSPYLKDALLNQLFRTTIYTKPGNHYLSLYNGDPLATGVELAGTGYARVAVAVADASWTAPATDGTDKSITNISAFFWPAVGSTWGTYTHVGFHDLAAVGNLLRGPVAAVSRPVNLNDQPPNIGAGALKLQIG